MYRSPRFRRSLVAVLLLIVWGLPSATFAQTAPPAAEKPAAPSKTTTSSKPVEAAKPAPGSVAGRPEFARLLPPETLAYMRVVNAPEVRTEWFQTAMGRMVEDPQFKPLWDQLIASIETAFTPVRDKIGLGFVELLTLPQGEFGFAVLPIEGAPPPCSSSSKRPTTIGASIR
ncbi:MAG: hypothetical protein QM775_09925 [Pirellulales bacterium]